MQSSITKLLLAFVLSVATCVVADKTVSVLDINMNVPSNEVIDSWIADLSNNLIDTTINVKKNCPGMVEAEIRVFQGSNMVNQVNQKMEKPIKDFENYGICASLEAPEPDDDDCSMAQGDQIAKDCDMSSWFTDMSPGEYKVECDFTQNNEIISSVTMNIKVEDN